MLFISHSVSGPEHANNSRRALCRFQFLDLLVSLAVAKYVYSGRKPTPSVALRTLLDEHVRWCAGPDPGDFRQRWLYNSAVDELLSRKEDTMLLVFQHNSGEENSGSEAKTMSFGEWQRMLDNAGLLDDCLSDRPMRLAYVRSKCACISMFDREQSFHKMTFTEFVEAICRIAFVRAKNYKLLRRAFEHHVPDRHIAEDPPEVGGVSSNSSMQQQRADAVAGAGASNRRPKTVDEFRRSSFGIDTFVLNKDAVQEGELTDEKFMQSIQEVIQLLRSKQELRRRLQHRVAKR
jgi:hypothetical protein